MSTLEQPNQKKFRNQRRILEKSIERVCALAVVLHKFNAFLKPFISRRSRSQKLVTIEVLQSTKRILFIEEMQGLLIVLLPFLFREI